MTVFNWIITALQTFMGWLNSIAFHGITAWQVALFGILGSVFMRWFLPFFFPKLTTTRDKSDGVRNR